MIATVYYYDYETGEVGMDIDYYGLHFGNGNCYFASGNTDYCIPIENLIEIVWSD